MRQKPFKGKDECRQKKNSTEASRITVGVMGMKFEI
jgi:hypothetical protein